MPDRSRRSGPRLTARGLSGETCGELVTISLMEARPAGLHARQLMTATRLPSPYYLRKGITWVRDFGAMAGLTPLIWDRRHGYRFSDNPVDWINYELDFVESLFNRVERFIKSSLGVHAQVRPEDDFARAALEVVTGMKSGLSMIVLAGATHRTQDR